MIEKLRELEKELQTQWIELHNDNPDNPWTSFYGYVGYKEVNELVKSLPKFLALYDACKLWEHRFIHDYEEIAEALKVLERE